MSDLSDRTTPGDNPDPSLNTLDFVYKNIEALGKSTSGGDSESVPDEEPQEPETTLVI